MILLLLSVLLLLLLMMLLLLRRLNVCPYDDLLLLMLLLRWLNVCPHDDPLVLVGRDQAVAGRLPGHGHDAGLVLLEGGLESGRVADLPDEHGPVQRAHANVLGVGTKHSPKQQQQKLFSKFIYFFTKYFLK
jgi:hypothetical protein